MTGEELRALLKHAKKSQGDLAEHLDVTIRSVNRWVNSTTPIARLSEYAIRYVLETSGFPPL